MYKDFFGIALPSWLENEVTEGFALNRWLKACIDLKFFWGYLHISKKSLNGITQYAKREDEGQVRLP